MSFRKGKVEKGEIISALEAIIKELRASIGRDAQRSMFVAASGELVTGT